MKPDNQYQVPSSDHGGVSQPAVDYARNQVSRNYEAVYPQPVSSQPVSTTQRPAAASYQETYYNQHEPMFGQVSTNLGGDPNAPERSVAEIKAQLIKTVRGPHEQQSAWSRWKPFVSALVVGLVYLGVSYNEVAVAQIRQYISPGSSLSTPVIVDPTTTVAVGQEPRIIIPKINVDVPVVYDETSYDEDRIQAALERGAVHYGTTALPGQAGNNVIVAHSSNNFFNSGKYKFAFVLLDRLETGDTFILHYEGVRYIYKVFNKQVIEPTDFSLVQPTDKPVTTLITCTPPGTSWRRLVVQAEQISPDPAGAADIANPGVPAEQTPIPGNAPSFWDSLFN